LEKDDPSEAIASFFFELQSENACTRERFIFLMMFDRVLLASSKIIITIEDLAI